MRTLCWPLQVRHWFCCFLIRPSWIIQVLSLIVLFLFLGFHMLIIGVWFILEVTPFPSSSPQLFPQALSFSVKFLHSCFIVPLFPISVWRITFLGYWTLMLSFHVLSSLSPSPHSWRPTFFASFQVLPSNCQSRHTSFQYPSSAHCNLCFSGRASFPRLLAICSKLLYHSRIFLQGNQLPFAFSQGHFWVIWWSLPFGAALLQSTSCTLVCCSQPFLVAGSTPRFPS